MNTFNNIVVTKDVPTNVSEIIALLGGNEKTVLDYNQEYGVLANGVKYCRASFYYGNYNFSDTLVVEPHTYETISRDPDQIYPDAGQWYKEIIEKGKGKVWIAPTPTTPYGDTYITKIYVK